MSYKKVGNERIGYCRICGNYRDLTWDHVPPKSCGNIEAVAVKDVFHIGKNMRYKQYQNGIKYRTVCAKCNNTLMGQGYDKILEWFHKAMIEYIDKHLQNSDGIRITSNYRNLAKAVCCKFLQWILKNLMIKFHRT